MILEANLKDAVRYSNRLRELRAIRKATSEYRSAFEFRVRLDNIDWEDDTRYWSEVMWTEVRKRLDAEIVKLEQNITGMGVQLETEGS